MVERGKDKENLEFYTVRGGTIDYGKDYEVKMCALLSLRNAGQKNLQNSWILVNADRCGAFDDLVFNIETTDGKNLTYLIQLKHGMDPSDISAREFKTKTNGSYYLQKYYQTILEIKTAIDNEEDKESEIINYLRTHQDEMIFILFTNRGTTKDCNFLKNLVKKSNIDTKLQLNQFIDTAGNISQLDCSKLDLKIDEGLRNLMEEKFFIFTKQIHIDKTVGAIETAIENLIKPMKFSKKILTEIIQKFVLFVTDWCRGELGGHYPLSKDHAFRVLFENIIQPYMVKFEQPKASKPFELNIWHEMIKEKSIILIDQDEIVLQFLNEFIYDKINKYCEDPKNVNLWKKHPKEIRKEILRSTARSKQIRICDAYECLWKSGQVPLILRADTSQDLNNILHLIKIFQHKFPVIILNVNENKLLSIKFPNSFINLQDLNQDFCNKILNLPVKLQGRTSIKLLDFMVDKMFHLINVKDLIYILTNNYNIGNQYENLQEMFVERSFEKVWIEAEVFERIPQEMFLVKCKSLEDFQLFLKNLNVKVDDSVINSCKNKINDKIRIVIFEDGKTLKQMEIFGLTRNKPTHVLVLHENNIEWIKSFGSIKNIAEFRGLSKNQGYSNINQIIKNVPNRVNLISACPGMGKSILMDYLALYASTEWWVLKINLLDYVDYYKSSFFENESIKHLNYFFDKILQKYNCNNELAKIIFKKYLLSKNIMVIFDAFDEIPILSQTKAKEMIKSICDSNYCTFLTTRPIYQTQLEELLNTFSVNIKMFTQQDQKEFLTNYFSNINDCQTDIININSFTNLLLEAAKENLNDNDQEFTGIPLQTKLIAEVFREDYQIFCETQEFENKRFDLLYLYEHFTNEKITIFCKKFGNSSEDLLVQYKSYRTLYALRILFTKEDLEELKIDEQLDQVLKLFPNTLQLMQKDGIIVFHNERVAFVHRTFAEYLSAEWLAENINTKFEAIVKKLVLKIFNPAFSVIRSIFDRILAKERPLLLSIIGQRRNDAKNILTSNSEALEELDKIGRNFLHLTAAWGVHHPLSLKTDKDIKALKQLVSKDIAYEIFNFVPNLDSANKKDALLGYTPLDYTVANGSLHIADYICSRSVYNNARSFFNEGVLDYAFDYILKMTYFSLMPTIAKSGVLRYINATFFLQGTIAQQVGANYLRRLAVSGSIRNLAMLINNETNINEVDGIGCTILHAAVMYGRVIMTNLLLEKGTDPNIKDTNGYTPLHWAAIKGFSNIVNLLLLKQAEVDGIDGNDRTALHLAIIVAENKNRNEIVSILIEYKASVIARDAHGKTPLHYCVEHKQIEIIKLLLQSKEYSTSTLSEVFTIKDNSHICFLHNSARLGFVEAIKLFLTHNPDLEIREVHGRTVLQIAAEKNQAEIINLLLSSKVPTQRSNIEALDDSQLTALHIASWAGDINTVKVLLDNGAKLEVQDEFSRTPLICAAHNGHYELVNFLLEKGANLEAKGERDRTPLIAAARYGHTDLVKLLLIKGANIEAMNNENMSALHFAAWCAHDDITKVLLLNGARYDKTDIYGRSPLICAATGGATSTVKFLLDKGVDTEIKDNEGMTALCWSCWNGHKEIVSLFLLKEACIETRDNINHIPLTRAAFNDHTDVVALLLSKGADLEAKGQDDASALYCAAWNGGTTTVEFLLSKGINHEATNNVGLTPLIAAAYKGNTKIVELFLAHDAKIEANDLENMSALHWAAWNGHTETVELLLSKGADLNSKNIYERYPLLSAATNGHSSTVEFLLSNGANIETIDDEGMTALHYATVSGHEETISLLLSKGASIEAIDQEGTTPLHYASYEGHIKAIAELLNNNADVNAVDEVKMTALHWAVHKSHLEAAEHLIEFGANLEAKNKDHQTPLDYIVDDKNLEAIQFLLAKGADIEARDANDRTVLHEAVLGNHVNLVELFLAHRADLDAQDMYQNTSLIYAANLGYLTIIRMLLSKGANLEVSNSKTETAIHWAVWNGHKEIVELLISQGVNLEVKDKNGEAPLIKAAILENDDMVNLLLEKGANIETKDNKGRTVLHCVVIKNIPSMVELLLLKGASIETRDNFGRSPLLCAVIEGHNEIMNLLLLKSADVIAVDNETMGVLHWAAWNGHKTITEQLIEQKLNLENENIYGRTPLICAAQRGHTDVVQFLIIKGASIEVKDNEDKSVLHLATINGHIGVVKLILDLKVLTLLNSKDEFGKTPLTYASSCGHTDVITALLSYGADLEADDHEGKTPLHWAAFNGCTDALEILLNHGANLEAININGQTPLIFAAQQGHINTVEGLILKGADVERRDNKGMSSLLRALDNDHVNIAKFLLNKGANQEAKDDSQFSALHYAVVKGFTEIVQLLLSKDVALNEEDDRSNTPLIYSIAGGHIPIAILLLLKGADVHTVSNIGITPLYLAVSLGHKDVVEMLLAKGAQIERKDEQGRTALILGAKTGHVEIVSLLLSQATNIEARDDEDATALLWASLEGHQDVVALLLAKGGDVNIISKSGLTSLISASQKGRIDIVSLLLENGANIKLKDNNGLTAFDWAKRNGHDEVATLLATHYKALKDNCVIS